MLDYTNKKCYNLIGKLEISKSHSRPHFNLYSIFDKSGFFIVSAVEWILVASLIFFDLFKVSDISITYSAAVHL